MITSPCSFWQRRKGGDADSALMASRDLPHLLMTRDALDASWRTSPVGLDC
jgi:hypothetical protein